MSSFPPDQMNMRRSPSIDAITSCREAVESSSATASQGTDALSQHVPSHARRTIDLFLSGPSAEDTARQATRLLLRNLELQGPSRAVLTIQRGIEQSIASKDPQFGPLRDLYVESGELEAARSGQAAMIKMMAASALERGHMPAEALAPITAGIQSAVLSMPTDILSILNYRENLTDKEIAARMANPNRRVMMAGNVTLASLIREHIPLLQGFLIALFTRINKPIEESQAARGRPAAAPGASASSNELFLGRDIEPIPAGHSSMNDATFACLIDSMGGKRLIASPIFKLTGIDQDVDESRQDQFAADYIKLIGPLLREAFADFDAEAHVRFIAQYPEYNQVVAKIPQITKSFKEEISEVTHRLVLQKLTEY